MTATPSSSRDAIVTAKDRLDRGSAGRNGPLIESQVLIPGAWKPMSEVETPDSAPKSRLLRALPKRPRAMQRNGSSGFALPAQLKPGTHIQCTSGAFNFHAKFPALINHFKPTDITSPLSRNTLSVPLPPNCATAGYPQE